MPPSVITLKLIPSPKSSSTVIASVAGTVTTAIKVMRALRRNTTMTSDARTTPITIASRTLVPDSTINSLWSYHLLNVTSAGSRAR